MTFRNRTNSRKPFSPFLFLPSRKCAERKIKQASGHGKLRSSKHRGLFSLILKARGKNPWCPTLEANLAVCSVFPDACLPGCKTQEGQND